MLKHKEEQKAEIIADTQKAVREIINGKMIGLTKLFEYASATFFKVPINCIFPSDNINARVQSLRTLSIL